MLFLKNYSYSENGVDLIRVLAGEDHPLPERFVNGALAQKAIKAKAKERKSTGKG